VSAVTSPVGTAPVGGPLTNQRAHNAVALAFGCMRDSTGGPTRLGL
jgi:hypothetical protein